MGPVNGFNIWTKFFGWLGDMISSFFDKLYALIPPVPGFVPQIIDAVHGLGGYASVLGFFVNWSYLGEVMIFVASMWGVAMAIQVARIVASFLTAGGGGT